jgi:hypothetical protein
MDLATKVKREGAVLTALVSNYGVPNASVLSSEQIVALFPEEINALVDKIAFLVNDDVDKESILSITKEKDCPRHLSLSIECAVYNKSLPAPASKESELTPAQKTLFPFLVTKSPKIDNPMIGFRPKEDKGVPLWFSVVSNDSRGLYCLGYSGESRLLDIEKIALSGYEEIKGLNHKEKLTACRKDFSADITPEDIRATNFNIASRAIPQAFANKGKVQLHKLLSFIPEIDAKKVLRPSDSPKI